MTRALALTQFLIVGLGAPLLHLMVRVQNGGASPGGAATPMEFVARHVLWFFAVPILYAAVSNALRGRVDEKPVRLVGIVLCVLLVLIFAVPFVLYLR